MYISWVKFWITLDKEIAIVKGFLSISLKHIIGFCLKVQHMVESSESAMATVYKVYIISCLDGIYLKVYIRYNISHVVLIKIVLGIGP